jgi:branched-subunit amino acid transport protein
MYVWTSLLLMRMVLYICHYVFFSDFLKVDIPTGNELSEPVSFII